MTNEDHKEMDSVVERMAAKWRGAHKKHIDWSVHDERPQCRRPMFERLRKQRLDYLDEAEAEAKTCIIMILRRLVGWQNMRRTQMGATDDSLMVDKKDVSDPSGEAAMRFLPTP